MVEVNNVTKLAITGNTKLTLQSMKEILSLGNYHISHVFGLSDENIEKKVNSVDLTTFCEENNIILDQSEDWDNFYDMCVEKEIDMVVTLGDSRIIPSNIVNSFNTIGNHGAVLPDVQGGASLVWGRLLNNGSWGISIMEIGEKVDTGDILKIKRFSYSDDTTEEDFTNMADKLTTEALIEVLEGDYEVTPNNKWAVRVRKHSDSLKAIQVMKTCVENNIPIYMPPRIPQDAKIKDEWPLDFVETFRIANNKPYPRCFRTQDWYTSELNKTE